MTRLIITILIQFIAISPVIVLALNRPDPKWKYLLLFALYYLFYLCLLAFPNIIPELKIIKNTPWNWSGKIYAIIGSLLFYIKFRKEFLSNDYIAFKQNNNSLKPKFFAIIAVFVLTIGLSFFAIKNSEERLTQLLFQFTMPGIDEELAFRGIMLGLLSNSLESKTRFLSINLGNPSLLITSILFGLCHSFEIDNNWNFHQNWFEFANMLIIGLLLGWITIKSGNILMAVISHNLVNTLPKIIFWI